MAGEKSEIAGDERVVLCVAAAAEHLALKTGFSVTSKAKVTGLLVTLLCYAPGETMYACEMALAYPAPSRLLLILLKKMVFQPTPHPPDPIHPIAPFASTI